jgi:hypothetical protein
VHYAGFGSRIEVKPGGPPLQEEGNTVQYIYIVQTGYARVVMRNPDDAESVRTCCNLAAEALIGLELLSQNKKSVYTVYVPRQAASFIAHRFTETEFRGLLITSADWAMRFLSQMHNYWMIPALTQMRDRSVDGKASGTHSIKTIGTLSDTDSLGYDDLPDTAKHSQPKLAAVGRLKP